MKYSYFLCLLASLTLTGCGTTQIYKVTQGAPTATLNERLFVNSERHSTTTISIASNGQIYHALYLYGGIKRPYKTLNVEANKPLIFHYNQSDNDEHCHVATQATLQANHTYRLVGGYHYGKTGFWIQKGHNSCSLAIEDDTTHEIISLPVN